MPEGTQGAVIQPVGKAGVLVAGTDVVRGISRLDQVGRGGYGERDGERQGAALGWRRGERSPDELSPWLKAMPLLLLLLLLPG